MHPAPSDEPGGLECHEILATSINLTWSPPAKDKQNGVIIGYKVEVEGPDYKLIKVTGMNAIVDDLRPNTKYIFKVSAKTAAGIGPPATLKCKTCEGGKIKALVHAKLFGWL